MGYASPTPWVTGLLLLRLLLGLFGTGYIHPDEWHQSGEFVAATLLPREGGTEKMALAWEFNPWFPARSATTIICSQLLLILVGYIYRLLGWTLSARTTFVVERTTFLLWMSTYDYLVHRLLTRGRVPPSVQTTTRLLFLSSAAALSIMARPFSNTLEALLLLAVLVLVQELRMLRTLSICFAFPENEHLRPKWWTLWSLKSFLLGAVGATGFFARFTFVLFAAPSALYYLMLVWHVACYDSLYETHGRWKVTIGRVLRHLNFLLPGLVGFTTGALIHMGLDTYIFRSLVGHRAGGFGGGTLSAPYSPYNSSGNEWREGYTTWWPPVIAPLNAASYNANTSNLALHGTHPRWLHAVVNGPMMFGSLVWGIALCGTIIVLVTAVTGTWSKGAGEGGKHKVQPSYFQRQVASWTVKVPMLHLLCFTIVVPLLSLSIQPHQEPRFLTPLLAPTCILAAGFISTSTSSNPTSMQPRKERQVPQRADGVQCTPKTHKLTRRRRWNLFFTLHALQGILTALFFSVLHQAGVVPAFRHINDAAIAVATGRGTEQNLIWPPMNRISTPSRETNPQSAWATYYSQMNDTSTKVNSIDLHVFTWRVFMPPLHLLRPLILPPHSTHGVEIRVRMHDPPGEDWIDLRPEIEAHLGPGAQHLVVVNTWEGIVAQAHATASRGYMTLLSDPLNRFVHLDTNHFEQLWELWKESGGWFPPAQLEVLRAVIAD